MRGNRAIYRRTHSRASSSENTSLSQVPDISLCIPDPPYSSYGLGSPVISRTISGRARDMPARCTITTVSHSVTGYVRVVAMGEKTTAIRGTTPESCANRAKTLPAPCRSMNVRII
ncbi:MAG: hypothetical protein WC379_15795 [Methanoregula sp.]